ncbi:farnesyl pyrophosphate synthase-like [Ptychodera flava]|uniref:farnesyl pyrophosphate synthase-like n=1 Tax=Ptychodera flava TaxID=63121 RepID=UPI003969D0F1
MSSKFTFDREAVTTQVLGVSQCSAKPGRQVNMAEPDQKKMKQEYDTKQFDQLFKDLVTEIIEPDLQNPEIGDAMTRFKEVIEYNVPGGKKNRGLTVVSAYRSIIGKEDISDEEVKCAMVLGWCVEWLQAFFLVADDIMDQSVTRRGQPCWYRKQGVGHVAVNDSFYIEACIYSLLKKVIRNKPYYLNVVELFHETTYQTIVGQSLDLITAPDGCRDLSRFTQERYDAIVKWKTAFYSFYLPVALAMYMAGIDDAESHTNAKQILLDMGRYFQIQDDFLDCYGDPSITGKIGTDIEDNKCSWLVVQALDKATPEQKEILKENYGINDQEKVAVIKKLYEELKLKEAFLEFEEQSYENLMKLVEKCHGDLPSDLFVNFAKRIYKRKK